MKKGLIHPAGLSLNDLREESSAHVNMADQPCLSSDWRPENVSFRFHNRNNLFICNQNKHILHFLFL